MTCQYHHDPYIREKRSFQVNMLSCTVLHLANIVNVSLEGLTPFRTKSTISFYPTGPEGGLCFFTMMHAGNEISKGPSDPNSNYGIKLAKAKDVTEDLRRNSI